MSKHQPREHPHPVPPRQATIETPESWLAVLRTPYPLEAHDWELVRELAGHLAQANLEQRRTDEVAYMDDRKSEAAWHQLGDADGYRPGGDD
jgi:hypothetical protein